MTTDGMKRRDFLRTVTTLVGAVALGGSASLLSGCGGNGGSSGTPTGPTLSFPPAPQGQPATSVASVLTNSGIAGISSASVGKPIDTLSSTTPTAAATEAATDLSNAVTNLPANAPLGIVSNGTVQTISVSAFQSQISTVLSQLANLPAGEGPTLQAGDKIEIITYTLSDGQMISSPAIVDGNGNVVFDTLSFLAFPSPSDSSHYVTQNTQVGANGAAATTLFNPVSGVFQFRDVVTGTANSEANGNLSASTPVTNLVVNSPTLGPGVTAGSPGTPVFKAVPVQSAAVSRQSGGGQCVTITVTFQVTITLFGITITETVTVTLRLCSTTSGASGGGI